MNTLNKDEIETLTLRIQSLSEAIRAEGNPVAIWNMQKDLLEASARLNQK